MKHKFLAKRYWKDQTTPMGDVDTLAKSFDNIINLSLGDPDVTTDEGIINFAFSEAKKGHTKYTDFRGYPELRQEISKFYMDRFKSSIDDKNIFVSTSACLGMFLVLESILDPGDEVIISTPYFTPYFQQIRLAGGVPVESMTYEQDDFQLNAENIEKCITERTKAIIINSPNNPTGAVYSMDTLKSIADLAIKHDLIVVSDEIYGSYTFDVDFVSMIEIPEVRDRLIILNSFSKDYTMTGWRLGNIIAPNYIIETCQAINENLVFTAPSISQRAGIYALRNRKSIQEKTTQLYKDRVLYAASRIKDIPWMSTLKPSGTFYLFVNIKETGLSSSEFTKGRLEDVQVLAIPGIAFGSGGEGYIRIACTVSIDKLREAFDRIENWNRFK